MEANELMIGDWVRIIDYSKKRKRTVIGMVTDLCCTGAVYIFHGEDELCYETNDDILPINITDDILDKNFEKCSNANSQPVYKITPSLFIGINHNLCHITTKLGDNFKVRHIHELQHIMRLLGLIEQANNIRI
nr:MAG TPA: hypothetical protein [Caudoviricetes sp.]